MTTEPIPAFPVPLNQGQGWQGMAPCDGMTLRDYFAAKAMRLYFLGDDSAGLIGAPKQIAAWSYAMADAMLKARETA